MSEITLSEANRWADGLTRKLRAEGSECSISIMEGKRYMRIVQETPRGPNYEGGRSAYGFIDKQSGLIYKEAGWKGPSIKTPARGDMRGADPYKGCTNYGMQMLTHRRDWGIVISVPREVVVQHSHSEVIGPPSLDYDPVND